MQYWLLQFKSLITTNQKHSIFQMIQSKTLPPNVTGICKKASIQATFAAIRCMLGPSMLLNVSCLIC